MSKSRIFILIILASILTISGLIIFRTLNANASADISDNPENQKIMSAMEEGYAAIGYAARTGDVTKLPEILVNTTDYVPSDDVRKGIEQVFGADSISQAGYLTAMQAKYMALGKVKKNMEAAVEKAKAESRELSSEEFQQVIKESNGVIPSSGIYRSPSGKTILDFKKIQIDGKTAAVYYDDGAAYSRATLVQKNGQWFISNIEAMEVHF